MTTNDLTPSIDWRRLLQEFEDFHPGDEDCQTGCDAFTASLIHPTPQFVELFLQKKLQKGMLTYEETVRALYFYLLEKRYDERLNLLHFAFHVFDDATQLPEDVINRTPFPHEEGLPSYRHANDPDYRIAPCPPAGEETM